MCELTILLTDQLTLKQLTPLLTLQLLSVSPVAAFISSRLSQLFRVVFHHFISPCLQEYLDLAVPLVQYSQVGSSVSAHSCNST